MFTRGTEDRYMEINGNHIVPAQPSSCHARWCSEPHHHNCELTHPETPFLDHATLIEVARDILPNKPKGEALIIRHLVAAEVSMLGMEIEIWSVKLMGQNMVITQVITHKYLHTNSQTLRLLRNSRNIDTTNTGLQSTVLHFSMDFLAQSLEGQPQKAVRIIRKTRQNHPC